jgi:hypothetical protein
MVFFSTYATVKNGDFIGNSKVTLRFINSFLGTAERKLTFISKKRELPDRFFIITIQSREANLLS